MLIKRLLGHLITLLKALTLSKQSSFWVNLNFSPLFQPQKPDLKRKRIRIWKISEFLLFGVSWKLLSKFGTGSESKYKRGIWINTSRIRVVNEPVLDQSRTHTQTTSQRPRIIDYRCNITDSNMNMNMYIV